jgi:tetratricopeptide (TPR) repeat protein
MTSIPAGLKSAHDTIQRGDWAAARRLYAAYIEQPTLDVPTWSNALILRGLCARLLDDPQAALEDLSRAIDQTAADTTARRDACFYRGCTSYRLGRVADGLRDHVAYAAVAVRPLTPRLFHPYLLGVGFDAIYHIVIDDCTLAIAQAPRQPAPYFARGIAHAKRGDLHQAFDEIALCLTDDIDADPTIRSAAHVALNELRDRLRQIEPGDAALMQDGMEYARYIYLAGDRDASLEIYDRTGFRIERRPHDSGFVQNMGDDGWEKTAPLSRPETVGAYFQRRK